MSGIDRRNIATHRIAGTGVEKETHWTFLSHHAHVLLCLAQNPAMRLRDIADKVGITERSAMRVITQLDEAGYLTRDKEGRRNHYTIALDARLRHPIEAHCTVEQLLEMVLTRERVERLEQHQAEWTEQRAG
jgi:DNA-binding MarR family transcriptional regulator